jgi:pyruvate kinase
MAGARAGRKPHLPLFAGRAGARTIRGWQTGRASYAAGMSVNGQRRTRIVATVGPATDAPEMIGRLVEAGVNVFRLNMTHAAPDWARRVAREVRTQAAARGTFAGLMMDLQGPSIRTGDLPAPLELRPGQRFTFTVRDGPRAGENSVSVNYEQFLEDIAVGDTVLIDAGVIQMRVVARHADRAECEVLEGGVLTNRRHLNLPGVTVRLPALTEKDLADVRLGLDIGVDFVSLSFVREARHLRALRAAVGGGPQPPLVIAKIEDRQAVRNLEDIIREADAVMIARGDLGIEMPYEELPILQRQVVGQCLRLGRPVIVATQILESMTQSPVPTRAEVTDAANAVFERADAVMLSGETSTGRYPLKCVEVLDRIARRIEASQRDGGPTQAELTEPRQKLVKSAIVMADELGAEAILVFTRTGGMARHVAWLRPRCSTIFALCETERTAAALSLSWGVRPWVVPFDHANPERSIEDALKQLASRGVLQSGNTAVIISSMTSGAQVVDAVQMRVL